MNSEKIGRNGLSRSPSNFSVSSYASSSDSDSFSENSFDIDWDNCFFFDHNRESDSDSFSENSSDSDSFPENNSDSDSDDNFSSDYDRKPECIEIPCPEGRCGCERLHYAYRVYSRELDTKNSKDLEWLKKGKLFPNLQILKINSSELEILNKKKLMRTHPGIFAKKQSPLTMVTFLQITENIENVKSFIDTLSKLPNLKELILIDTGLNQKLQRVVYNLIDMKNLKKITLQDKDFTKIPDLLLVLPNIEQITIGKKTYDKTIIETERNSRDILIVDKGKLIRDIKKGHFDAVKQRIKSIDLMNLREGLLKIAVFAGQTDILKLLINNSIDVDARYKNGNTLLMEAARGGYFDVAKVLIDRGANVKAKNKEGKTALSLAIDKTKSANKSETDKERIKIIKLLGNNGADLSEKDEFGQSLLCKAIVKNNADLVKALLGVANTENVLTAVISLYKNKESLSKKEVTKLRDSSAIDVNERLKGGKTPLMYAVKNRRNEIVGPLLDYGADINAQDDKGNTCLMEAEKWANLEIAMFLLDQGADPFIKNKEGETSLSMAEKELKERWTDSVKAGFKEVIKRIKSDKRYNDFVKTTNRDEK